jgi:hypothetical protein
MITKFFKNDPFEIPNKELPNRSVSSITQTCSCSYKNFKKQLSLQQTKLTRHLSYKAKDP